MSDDVLERLTIKNKVASPGSKRRLPLKFAVVVIALLVAGGAVYGFWSLQAVTVETTTVSRVYPSQSLALLNASGYVVAQRKAAVASKTTGRLEWIGVEEGSVVAAGQVIARLENNDLQALVTQGEASVRTARATLEQAQAELGDARLNFTRQKELLNGGIVSRAEFDTAETRYKRSLAGVTGATAGVANARAALQGSLVNLDYTRIKAPFSAVVLTKNADVGDIITPLGAAANAKAAVVTIADLSSLQVEADVSESNLSLIKAGQPCEITLDALPSERFRGTVSMIVPTADRTKASIMVKVRFMEKDPRILPEMSAKVAFLQRQVTVSENKPLNALNPSAIVKSGSREGVYLIRGEKVVFTPLTRGVRLGDMVEVRGIEAGSKVALSPLDRLKDGARIMQAEKK